MDQARLLRILDANLNRSREALRVLEEVFRFGRDEADLAARLKTLRHRLQAFEEALEGGASGLVSARDPEGDVGRHAPAEPYRRIEDLVHANARRLEEALRVLEEYGRLAGGDAEAVARARFEVYEIEKRLAPGLSALAALQDARLYFLLNASGDDGRDEALVRDVLEGGADIVQIRAFPGPDRAFLALARRLRRACEERGALLIVNDRLDIAMASGAHGVHLGQDDLPPREARRILGPSFLLGLSTHAGEEARDLDPVDSIGVGCVFPSAVKPGLAPIGPRRCAEICRSSPRPAFPIGGIGPGNLRALTGLGVGRAAVSTALSGAPRPAETARILKEALLEIEIRPPGERDDPS